MVYFWIAGIVLGHLAALSNVYLAREVVFGTERGRRCLRGRVALLTIVALASSAAGVTLVASAPLVGAAFLLWLCLATLTFVAFPLWSARFVGMQGVAMSGLRPVLSFFVLPAGGLASKMFERISGHPSATLDESFSGELSVLFSAEAASFLQKEPLASVVREFARTTAEDVMVPRSAMVTVPSTLSLSECVGVFSDKKFSRLPVYEGEPESIIGLVHVMDLLGETDLSKTVGQFVRPVLMVPQTKRCDELLKEFQKSHGYLAIVLDEYGGLAGLVTVEDLLEELVGEMGYEPLTLRRTVRKVVQGMFLVHGQVEVEKFESVVGVRIPKGDYETLAGYLLREFGRIPEPGAKLIRGQVLFEVVEADVRKIKLVRVWLEGLYPKEAAVEAQG